MADPLQTVGKVLSPAFALFSALMPSEPAQQPAPSVNVDLPQQIQPGSAPQTQKPGKKSMSPTFLSQGMVPMQTQTSGGGKTLLGQ